MKTREPRQKVVLRARMRSGAAWSDVCIVDVSSRGLGLQSASPPPRGAFVELRKGPHVIIAQVVWSSPSRFGARSQDRLSPTAIIHDVATSDSPPGQWNGAERRSSQRQRQSWQAEQSRQKGRAMEFIILGIAGVAGATALFGMVESGFAQTIAAVETGLSGAQKQ